MIEGVSTSTAGVFPGAARAMVDHCEARKGRVCILQSALPAIPTAAHQPPVESAYAAHYHPWPCVASPDGAGTSTVPPGGHVAGLFARTDLERGVWKAPAGAPSPIEVSSYGRQGQRPAIPSGST